MQKPSLFWMDLTESFGRKVPEQGILTKALQRAMRATEFLLTMDLNPRQIDLEADLSHGALLLEHYPVKNLGIEEVSRDLYLVDEENGLIEAMLPPHMHKISYQVGDEIDALPLYVQELLKKLTQWQLMRDLVGEGEIEVLVQSGRFLRTKISAERKRHAETLRESEGQRLLQYR